jgi:cold-inducible RNA-binding protein
MKLYVGNLSREVEEEDLKTAFAAFGQVDSVSIIKDRFSGVSKGFAFIEMPVKVEAENAIAGLRGTELKGRSLDVNEARPREERRPGGGGGGYRGGGGGGRRGGGGGGGGRHW